MSAPHVIKKRFREPGLLCVSTMSVPLYIAVVVCVTILVRALPGNLLESIAIHNEVESVRCNSNKQDFTDYYSRLQRESRERNEYDHYYPSANCRAPDGSSVGYYPLEIDDCCKRNPQNQFFLVNCSDYLNGTHVNLPTAHTQAFFRQISCLQIDIGGSIPQSSFEWCIWIKSNRYNLHACYNTSGVASYTSDAAKADLLDLIRVPQERTFGIPSANLVHLSPIANKAFMTCSVRTQNYSAIRYMSLNILPQSIQSSPLFSVPFGVEPFLRAGDEMKAFCGYSIVVSSTLFFKYVWRHNDMELPMCQTENNCTNRVEYIAPKEFIRTDFQCKEVTTSHVVIKQIALVIYNAQAEDVGSYTCSSINFDTDKEVKYHAGTIHVVYTEFPNSLSVVSGSNHSLNCSLQAPKTATVYWIADRSGIVVNKIRPGATCSDHQEVDMFTTLLTSNGTVEGFSQFTLMLHICNASSSHADQYSCVVSDPNMTKSVSLSFTLNYIESVQPTALASPSELIVAIVLTVLFVILSLFAVLVMGVLMAAFFAKKTKRVKITGDKEWILIKKSKHEYPRKDLIMLKNLASGSFGQVYKAQADGIVNDDPTLNIIAVKTLKENFLPSERCDLLSELDLMKKIKPHPNICNFIAQCTLPADQPPCIIIEYASHGNLRELLIACREAMELIKQPIRLLTSEETWLGKQKKHGATDKDTLSREKEDHHQVVMCPNENTACVPRRDYTVSPGGIYDEDIVRFCQQILAGLCHLEKMKILHRDISARNILVAKGFCLKVSDFGFAKDISEKEYYRKLTDGLIPVKWAALEALQQQIYTSKSDVWSFGVLVWEMASYGNSPYSSISLSYGWEDLIRFLQEGHRLPVPSGCNNNLYNLMQQCWHADPEARSSFSQLQSRCHPQAGLL